MKSRYHIDGYLTDFECVADLDNVSDVQVFKNLLKGYEGPGVIKNEWGYNVFQTIGELGLMNHPMARFQPNGEWTEVIPEADWPAMKIYVENKLAKSTPPEAKPNKATRSSRISKLKHALSKYKKPLRKKDGLPWIRKVRRLTGDRDVTLAEIRKYWKGK